MSITLIFLRIKEFRGFFLEFQDFELIAYPVLAQLHEYELMPSLQTPPFWQGFGWQSLMLISQ